MCRCRATARRSSAGLTILELMITLALVSLFVGAVYEAVIVNLRTVNSANGRERVRQQLAYTLDRLTREAAMAGNVDAAEDQRLQFDADLDGDGSNETNINYRVQNGDFERRYSGDSVVLVPDLVSLDFNYVDDAGATLATPVASGSRDDIRVAQITLSATYNNETISLASAVYLRNNN